MKLKFLGSASDVGCTSLLIETKNFRGIFEYGLSPSDPPIYPLAAPPVDKTFLTHAHLDHSGMVPWLINKYDTTLFATDVTCAISRILLRDNLKICKQEGYPLMYSKVDIRNMIENQNSIEPNKRYNLDHTDLTIHTAGHIPGSVMFQVDTIGEPRILFTGDINTTDTRLIQGTKGKETDILIIEGTYAGREHDLRPKIEYNFQKKVKTIVENGGKVIVPAFAVGRTQEMLLVLGDLNLDIWMDGLGIDVTKLLLKFPGWIRNSKKLKKVFDKVNKVGRSSDRDRALKADIILTTSGMLDGGPVLNYINKLKGDQKNAILLTGYQVEGSNGKLLIEKGEINLYGNKEKINLEVESFDFSAHAGHKELIKFINECNPEHIILYHSDNRELLKQDLEESYQVHLPKDGKYFDL